MILFEKIKQWGHDRGIIANSTPMLQFNKTLEEVNELEEAIMDSNLAEIKDAIGDITVTLVLQAELNGLDYLECVQSAYDIISKRKGKMVNGIFVKES
jgi:NTP pyrophosphatase (non-canonical NTP hydrolase)